MLKATDLLSLRYQPGFAVDLTSWTIFLGRDGSLRQRVAYWNPASEHHNTTLTFHSALPPKKISDVQSIIQRIEFSTLARSYRFESMCITDLPWYSIAVRFARGVKEVVIEDLDRLADLERRREVVGCREIWNAVASHAPFGKAPITAGLPRPWWQFWYWST